MNRIEQFRKTKGWSRVELAKESGVSAVTIWKLEKEGYKAKALTIRLIATALGIFFDELWEFVK